MNEIQIFNNSEFGELGIIEIDGKPYFPASRCAEILGYSNPRKAIIDHCKGVTKRDALSDGGIQEVNFIPEGDLYRLIIRSKLPAAERFERWVFDEVLPSIRKTGGYVVTKAKPIKPSQILRDNIYTAEAIAKATGIDKTNAVTHAIALTEKETGEDLSGWLTLLPSHENTAPALNATAVGELIETNARKANLHLFEAGLQIKDSEGNWHITEKGREYGEEFYYERNGHNGTQIRWNATVAEVLR